MTYAARSSEAWFGTVGPTVVDEGERAMKRRNANDKKAITNARASWTSIIGPKNQDDQPSHPTPCVPHDHHNAP